MRLPAAGFPVMTQMDHQTDASMSPKRIPHTLRRLWLSLALLFLAAAPLRADQFELFTYQIVGGTTIEITDYPESATGAVVIPAEIVGKPVTSIGYQAFYNCWRLTSVTIPSSVTSIGDRVFLGCTVLASITVRAGNTRYASAGGVLFNVSLTTLITYPEGITGAYSIPSSVTTIGDWAFLFCPGLTSVSIPSSVTSIGDGAFYFCSGLTSVSIPSSVTSIGNNAFTYCSGLTSVSIPSNITSIGSGVFYQCSGLTSVTIPSSVTIIGSSAFSGCSGLTSVSILSSITSIGDHAFRGCSGLTKAVFLGNAPLSFGAHVFDSTAQGFTVYYLSSRTDFTFPTWRGYEATRIDEAVYPAASWLLGYGLEYDADLHSDPNGDGVSLLMAYALDVDPIRNTPSRLPVAVMGAGTMSLNFKAGKPGVLYRVETSTDLLGPWTATGVTQSAPGVDGQVTATVNRDGPKRFLRLLVQD